MFRHVDHLTRVHICYNLFIHLIRIHVWLLNIDTRTTWFMTSQNPGGGTPIFEGKLCKALRTPFFSGHSSSKGPLKLCSVPNRPNVLFVCLFGWLVVCFCVFLIKYCKFATEKYFGIFDQKWHICLKNDMFFFFFFLINFHHKLWKNAIFRTFCHKRPPFFAKIPLLTRRSPFFVIFASPNAPYIENQGFTSASVLYGSAPSTKSTDILISRYQLMLVMNICSSYA